MAPAAFALGLDVALDQSTVEEDNVPWVSWYLDDGTIIGSMDGVPAYVDKLVPALASIGLEVNPQKSRVWGPGAMMEGDLSDSLPDSMPLAHPMRLMPIVPFGPSAGVTVLGIPCDTPGSDSHARKKWASAVTNTTSVLDKLRRLPDGQLRHALVRHCLDACKVNHLMRATPHTSGAESVRTLSDALKVAVLDLIGCGMTNGAWEQATMPISVGGLGIRDPASVWPEARIAALANFHSRACDLGIPSDLVAIPARDTLATVKALCNTLGGHHEPVGQWLADVHKVKMAEPAHCKQSWWAEQVARARRAKLPSLGTARDRARLDAQEGALAHAWLTVVPSRTLGTCLSDSDFRSLCRFWLGIPLLPDGCHWICPACGDPCDAYGDHWVSCPKNGISRRHNSLRDELARILAAASVQHAKEVTSGDRKRPADILLVGWDRGRDICVDLTVTNPLCASNHPLQPGVGRAHLGTAEREKIRLEGPLCAKVGWGFHPAAFSPWGGQGPKCKWLIEEITKRVTADLPMAAHAEQRN